MIGLGVAGLSLTACIIESGESASTSVATTTTEQVTTTTEPPVGDSPPAAEPANADCDLDALALTTVETVLFDPGTSGTRISKTLEESALHAFILGASAGQTMTVSVSGGNSLEVYDVTTDQFLAAGTNVSVPLPTTGDYEIDVYSPTCAATAYDLQIDIPAGGLPDQGAAPATTTAPTPPSGGSSACPEYTDFTTPESQNWPMRLCQKGPLVSDVQQALKNLGYDVDVDGFFGPGTAAAVGQWRGDGVGELTPPDLEALLPRDVEPAIAPGGTPPLLTSELYQLPAVGDVVATQQLLAGDQVIIQLIADPSFGADPAINLFDPAGTLVAFDDDSNPTEGPLDSLINVTVATSGEYRIVMASVNGVGGFAQLVVDVNGS